RYILYPVEYVERSPVFTTSGLLEMFNHWRNNPEVFQPMKHITAVSRSGTEEVIIYEIRTTQHDHLGLP
ncbi:MAG: hypothetical protein U9Q79_12190, partial [Candidatus Hydrogenedentes bacterium]|nr:hypothetical protein [Candidatus Hydrogenedentota bacterium]